MADQGYLSGPHIQCAVLCEKVLQEKDGAISLIRMVDRVTISGQQPEMPSYPYSVTLFLAFKSGFFRGKARVKIAPISPNGEELNAFEFPLLFEGDDERGALIQSNMTILLKEEGLYWFDVSLAANAVTRIPLRVVYQQVGVIPESLDKDQ